MKKSQVRKLKPTVSPSSIKAIIVIDCIIALLLLLLGISLIASSIQILKDPSQATEQFLEALKNYPSSNIAAEDAESYVLMIAKVAPYFGAILLILAFTHVLLAIYLKRRKNWARMTQIVLAIFAIIYSLLIIGSGNFVFGILFLLIEGWIASYLLFTPGGKDHFS
ncbi:hypothetical protein FJZ18_02360 [Candidatus Pacearchaeota archaeon]|nr:hypothetical protein [Candidatus Pacearchaeota archaeon]